MGANVRDLLASLHPATAKRNSQLAPQKPTEPPDGEGAGSGVAKALKARKTAPQDEAGFMRRLMDFATLHGWLLFHDADSRKNAAGLPDLVLVRPPRVVFAELKAGRGKVRDSQREWLSALFACPGVETYLWYEAHEEQAREVLK